LYVQYKGSNKKTITKKVITNFEATTECPRSENLATPRPM